MDLVRKVRSKGPAKIPELTSAEREAAIVQIKLIASEENPRLRATLYDTYLIALNDRETIEDYLEQFRAEKKPLELVEISSALSYATDPFLVTEFEADLAFGDQSVGVLYGDVHVQNKPFKAGQIIAGIFTHSDQYPPAVREWGRRHKNFGSRRINIALMRWFEENREYLEKGEWGKVSAPIDPQKLPEELEGWEKSAQKAPAQPVPQPAPDAAVSEQDVEEADATAHLVIMGTLAALVALAWAVWWIKFRKPHDADKG